MNAEAPMRTGTRLALEKGEGELLHLVRVDGEHRTVVGVAPEGPDGESQFRWLARSAATFHRLMLEEPPLPQLGDQSTEELEVGTLVQLDDSHLYPWKGRTGQVVPTRDGWPNPPLRHCYVRYTDVPSHEAQIEMMSNRRLIVLSRPTS